MRPSDSSYIADLESRMKEHAANLEFEEAAHLRDEIKNLEAQDLGMSPSASLASKVERAAALSKSTRGGRGGRGGKGRYRRRR